MKRFPNGRRRVDYTGFISSSWTLFLYTVSVSTNSLGPINMPLHVLASLWLGVSTNVDNLGVGMAYGVKQIRIGRMSNLLIAFFNATATLVSMSAGERVSQFLSAGVSGFIGNLIIVLVGLWGLVNTFGFGGSDVEKTPAGLPQEIADLEFIAQNPEVLDADRSGHINTREALPLAFGLSISNLGTGVGAGLAGFNTGFVVLIMFLFSILGISLGYAIGRKFSMVLPGRWPGILSGILLIGLGVYNMLS